jgi:dihydrolipoamide dehydrogenase
LQSFDLCVLGAGPGGYVAAIRAAKSGKSVCLIEKREVGGTCLNRGCIPTKALTSATELLAKMKKAESFGITVGSVEANFPQMMKRKDQTVARLVKGIHFLLKKCGVTLMKGEARITGPGTVSVHGQEVKARDILIATGARPVVFPQFGHDGNMVITSDEALELEELPEDILIIGGGVIGCEFASIFATLGCKVKIVEMLPRLLPMAEGEVSRQLTQSFKRMGIEIYVGKKVVSVDKADSVKVQLDSGEELTGDKMLVSIGRGVNTEGLGLEKVGIKTNQKGEIIVDEGMATNVPHFWAIGDVTDCPLKLAHVASVQGLVVVDNISGEKRTMDYGAIPNCVFTQPEIAWVGLSEEQAQEQGYDVQIGKFPFIASGKALAMGDYDGFVKVVADSNGDLLGIHIIGPHASDLIADPTLALSLGLNIEEYVTAVRAHPTLPEAVMEAAEAVFGRAIHC